MSWCDFWTGYAGKCGVWVGDEGVWCKYHQNRKESARRQVIGKYSGYSKYRQKTGEFQGKRAA